MNNDEDSLADLLVRWEELQEQGQDVSAIELCQQAPHLADELARRIRVLKDTAWLDRRFDADTDTDSTSFETKEIRTLADRYRLDELVAEGGFAQVWKAFDLELHRSIAIKLPKPSRLASADAFMTEARRVARLKHPGIVPVHDVGRDNGNCFIVSEFIEGGNLASQMSGGVLPPQKATRWAAEIAEALQYAHANGIIHRDIKPANILIDHHGRALLADFGIAQSANKTGMFAPSIGTLRYMSPEQLAGKESDVRSDIYSLGVVLHELLTGKLPYSSDLPTVLKQEIVSGATVDVGNVPPELKRICAKALELNPKDRYASADAFALDLRRNFEKPKRPGVVLGVVPVVLVLCFGLFSILQKQPPNQTVQTGSKPLDASWFARVQALPVDDQVKEVVDKIKELNPGYAGEVISHHDDGVVNLVEMHTDNVTNIAPLAAFKGLKFVNLSGTFTWKHNGQLVDISPLKGLPIQEIDIHSTLVEDLSPLENAPLRVLIMDTTKITDLTPIRNAKLTRLDIHNTFVSDLTPLKDMQLTTLHLANTQVKDLSPLKGMPINDLRCQYCGFSDISPLKGMPLHTLECHGNPITDLSPLQDSLISNLNIYKTNITDWSPLTSMPRLRLIGMDFDKSRDSEILRSVVSLEEINQQSAKDFWKNVQKPANYEEALRLGNWYFNLQQHVVAAQYYTTAIGFDAEQGQAFFKRGQCQFHEEKYKESLSDFSKALEIEPDNKEYLHQSALASYHLREFDQAISAFDKLLTLDSPNQVGNKKSLAVVLSKRALNLAKAMNYTEAIADLDRAIDLDPNGKFYHGQRADCFFVLGDFEKAIVDYTEAIGREPNEGSHYSSRGKCYQALNQSDKAESDFAKATELEAVK